MPQCTAKSKQTGEQCKRAAAVGQEVCKIHGGKSLAGPAHKNFKNGFYWAENVPLHLRAEAEAFHSAPEVLQLLSEIAVGRARIGELFDRIREHGGGTWKDVAEAWSEFQEAVKGGDQQQVNRVTRQMNEVVHQGKQVDQAWKQIDSERLRLARLVKVQGDLEDNARQNLKGQQALTFMVYLVEAVQEAHKRHLLEREYGVSDDEVHRRIMADVSAACRAAATGQLVPTRR